MRASAVWLGGLEGSASLPNENGGSVELGGQHDRPVIPVVVPHGERHGGRNETLCESDVTSGDGEMGNHLSQSDHDGEADGSDGSETHEESEGSTVAHCEGNEGRESANAEKRGGTPSAKFNSRALAVPRKSPVPITPP